MTLLNAALAFVFFVNLVFMVGASYALWKIMHVTETSQINLQRAASDVIGVGTHIKVLVRKAFSEMERNNDALAARESHSGRAVQELSFQVKTLVERVKTVLAKREDNTSTAVQAPASAEHLRERLHNELSAALAKNHELQDEIDQTHYKLKDASHTNRELQDEISDVKGVKQSVIDSLMKRTVELEERLQQARERAQAAERHADATAAQMDEIRAQIDQQPFAEPGGNVGIDQSELIEQQQNQIDVLATRERELLVKIDHLEGAFQRNLTEKTFIEERFLAMDAGETSNAPLEASPSNASS
jgi:DNA repair exonuclease SbcCD ATPase subunit